MKYLMLIVLIFLMACSPVPTKTSQVMATETIADTSTPTVTVTSSLTATVQPTKTPTMTATATSTVTPTATITMTTTAYPNGSINCPGSVALMYHRINKIKPAKLDGYGIDSDVESFGRVIDYLVNNNYYFPTPKEFAKDVSAKICRHKYAVVIIDDSWNDPVKMGVTEVLVRFRKNDAPVEGQPNVWLALITNQIVPVKDGDGNWVDQYEHLKKLRDLGLVYVVSHSQTHPAALNDTSDFYGEANNGIYGKIASELGPSRVDIIRNYGEEPFFFVYPGGNVNRLVADKLVNKGYSGGFTVYPGGLDKAFAAYLPRINAGYGCGNSIEDNSRCVIDKIIQYGQQ